MFEHRVHDRDNAVEVIAELSAWDGDGRYVNGLHAGDIGWWLRVPDEQFTGAINSWWSGSEMVATALIEDPTTARPRVRPSYLGDRLLARELANGLEQLPGGEVWSDAAPGTALRQELVRRGWCLDPDPWVALYVDLSVQPVSDVPHTVRANARPVDRVRVQRIGFERSTFDEPSWRRMAAGPGYRPDLDLVLHDEAGPAAVATAWLSVPGGTAILEPVATDPARRGRGLGRQVVTAAVEACRAAGASGVSVCTPCSNAAAIATYRSAGFRPIETLQALTIDRGLS